MNRTKEHKEHHWKTGICPTCVKIGKAQAIKEVLEIIDNHIVEDDYMSICTKQSFKELKEKIQALNKQEKN